MVIEDFTTSSGQKPDSIIKDLADSGLHWPNSSRISLGLPIKRLAAILVDLFLVVIPVSTLLVAPLKKGLVMALILKESPQSYFYMFLIGLAVLTVVVVYQTLMVKVWGATLGKLFWGLRVRSLWDGSLPSLSQAFLRSLFWLLDSVLFLLPHLSVFTDEKRRPFHDRVADTLVVDKGGKGTSEPGLIEASFVRGIVSAFILFLLGLFLLKGLNVFLKMEKNDSLVNSLEKEGSLCSEVGEAIKEDFNNGRSRYEDRLRAAMVLFASGKVNIDCLEAELNLAWVRGEDASPLAYLAKSFVYADNATLSDRYLDEVCRTGEASEDCKMSQVVRLWTEGNWTEIDTIFSSLESSVEEYILVWAIRHFIRTEEFSKAELFLDRLGSGSLLGSFVAKQRVKIYWGLNDMEKVRAATEVAFATLDQEDVIDLSSWLCGEELKYGCENAQSNNCSVMNSNLIMNQELLSEGRIALRYLRRSECTQDQDLSYDMLMTEMEIDEARTLLSSFVRHKGNEEQRGRRLLWKLVQDEESENEYREEARHYLAKWAGNSQDLEALYSDWQKDSESLNWRRRGQDLLVQYFRLKNYKRSWEIAKALEEREANRIDKRIRPDMIVAGYRSGEKALAYALLKKYELNRQSPTLSGILPDRRPASEISFEEVARVLKSEFGER